MTFFARPARFIRLRYLLPLLLPLATLAQPNRKPAPAKAGASPPRGESPHQAITHVLTTQTAAWNRGDIPGFMAGYWHSDSLVFVGKGGPSYGWQTTLDNYRRHYPTATDMGQLDFTRLRISPLGPETAQVIGHWHLARPGAKAGDLQGWFLLVFRRIGGQWLIAADHSSSE